MAETHGKSTGEPGVSLVTRGLGSTNTSIAVCTAPHHSTPMILFIGQVGRDSMGREAWQEIDYRYMFGLIDDARRLQEFISCAVHVATLAGPAVLAFPRAC